MRIRDEYNLKFLTLFINPVLAFFLAVKNLNTGSSLLALFVLSIVFGVSFSVPNVRTESNNFDGIGYRIYFEKYAESNSYYYTNNWKYYINFTDDTDFFDDTVFFIVSRFTSNYHIMYMFVTVIFSVLLLRSLKLLVSENNYRNSIYCFILVYLFTSNQIININAFRFYIALWLVVFSLFKCLVYNKRIYLLPILFSPFIHASFFLLYLLLPLYFIFRHFSFLRSIFIISLFFSGFSPEFLQNFAEFMPDTIGLKVLSYTNENYMYEINESGSGFIWIKRMFEVITVGYINLLVLIMLVNYKSNIKGTKIQNLFLFLLLLMSFVNFTLIIPSVGSRFIMMALPFIAYIWLICFSERKFAKYIYGLGGLFLLHAILPFNIYQFPCLRFYIYLLEPSFYINSPLVSFVKYSFFE